MHVDRNKKMGDFWLAGSQIFQMMKGVSESLAGRVGIIPMQGLSLSEINRVPNEPYKTEVSRFLSRLAACAARTSQMVNYSEIAKDVGISSPTAKNWLSLLVTSGIVPMSIYKYALA